MKLTIKERDDNICSRLALGYRAWTFTRILTNFLRYETIYIRK